MTAIITQSFLLYIINFTGQRPSSSLLLLFFMKICEICVDIQGPTGRGVLNKVLDKESPPQSPALYPNSIIT